MRVSVFDYGAGNLHSLLKAIASPHVTVRVDTDAAAAVRDTDALVLPGVGAFGAAARRLASGRDEMRAAIDAGLPAIGICLGMQLMFDGSDEGDGAGLGIFSGRVTRLEARRVPQIGWNALEESRDALFDDAPLGVAYYANGFVCRPADARCVRAWSTHEGDRFPAVVRHGNVVGVQFHPEKSSASGVRFLRTFFQQADRRS